MTTRFNPPWLDLWLEQVWACAQVGEVVAKTMDPQLLLDPEVRTASRPNRFEDRLNPLEFHGKRQRPSTHRITPRRTGGQA